MYAITGATGNIGSKVTDILLSKGEKMRVIGRNAAKLQHFVDKGAEAAIGDLRDVDFVTRAFTDVTAVFAMIPPNYKADDFRGYQKLIGESLATGIRESGVRYVVNLSSQGAELTEGTGAVLGLHDQEERLNRLEAVNVLHLRPTYFMENLLMNIPLILHNGIAGSAVRGDQRIAMIATRDIANYVVERLMKRDFEGKKVQDLLGQRDLSLNEATNILGRAIGKPELRYVQFGYEEASKGMTGAGISADVSSRFIEMSKALNDGLFAVNRKRTPDKTTPTSIEEFAETFARIYAASTMSHAA